MKRSPKPVKTAPRVETNVLLDEVKSVADVVRSIQTELFWLKSSVAGRSDLESVKTELRLVRSDLAGLEKRLSSVNTVEARP